MPLSYKSPHQMLAEFGLKEVEEEEFLKMPNFLRLGLTTQKTNDALLSLGKKSRGDRQHEFKPSELTDLERKVRPILRRLGRIEVKKTGEFFLK